MMIDRMSLRPVSLLTLGKAAAFCAAVILPGAALAQDALDEAMAPEGEAEPAAAVGTDATLEEFELDRGFYLSSDLGIHISVGGVNGYSNLQPFMAIKGGVDINDMLSVQLSAAAGYVSANPATDFDNPASPFAVSGNQANSYSLLHLGPELVVAIRPTERFAIEPRLGGGVSMTSPALTQDEVGTLYPAFLPMVSFGADFKYLTLLTGFTAGLSLNGYYVIGPNIPSVAAAFSVRYTL